MNQTQNDKYFIVECRSAYLIFNFSVVQKQRFAILSLVLSTYYILSGYFWWVNKHLPRLQVRTNAITLVALSIFPLHLITLALYTLNKPFFLNTCFIDKFGTVSMQLVVLLVLTYKTRLYFLQYKLHKVVCKEIPGLDTATQIKRLKKSLSTDHVNKTLLSCILAIHLFGSLLTLIFCPTLGPFKLCANYGSGALLYFVVSYLVVFLLFLSVCMNIYYTAKHPDPFGILSESLTLNFIYGFNLSIYSAAINQQDGNNKSAIFCRQMIVLHLGFCLYFTVMIPGQVFLAKRGKLKALTFDDIIKTPKALKTFRIFTEKIFTVEQLQFYLDAVAFRSSFCLANKDTNLSRARNIYKTYVAIDAPDRINLSDTELLPVIIFFETSSQNVSKNIFDKLISGVYKLLELDSFSRFTKSDLYNLYCGLSQIKQSKTKKINVEN